MARMTPGTIAEVASDQTWRGRLFIDTGMILYVGPGSTADRHAHHAVQLVWADHGHVTLSLSEPLRRRAALIPSDVPHSIDATGSMIALLLVESNGAVGAALDKRARTDLGRDVEDALVGVGFPALLTAEEVTGWCARALDALGARGQVSALSSLSRRAVAYIESMADGMPRLADAADHLGVSPTHLTHVFTRDVGIPFRRFVLWTRIKNAASLARAGATLTTAAVAAGFSDAAHFSRTFREMFGLSPTLVLPVAQIIATAAAKDRDRLPKGAQ
jgi:AraC-like DNA-binding protein